MTVLDRNLLYGNTETLVLALLSERPSYGYLIQRELLRRSRYTVQFAFGRLYPMLHRMLRRGWVVREREPSPKGPGRWVYSVTPAGLAELGMRRKKWEAYAAGMTRILR